MFIIRLRESEVKATIREMMAPTKMNENVPVSNPCPKKETFGAGERIAEARNAAAIKKVLPIMALLGSFMIPSIRRPENQKMSARIEIIEAKKTLLVSNERPGKGRKKTGIKKARDKTNPNDRLSGENNFFVPFIVAREKINVKCLYIIEQQLFSSQCRITAKE